MTISFNWLKEYIKTELSAPEIATILTDIGLEVDSIQKVEAVRGGLEGIVAGHVLTCEKHADADKLKVTTVSTGEGEPLQIVCGAPNVAAEQKVLVATINTTLYPKGSEEGFKIKRSKIRGVESFGMICAEDELGLGTDHDGIMVLDGSIVPGTPARDIFNLEDDYIIEIGLTPNRVDAASHFGVARDLHAYLKVREMAGELSLPHVDSFSQDEHGREIKIDVRDTQGAPRYSGVTISGIKIAPSPEWLQSRLRSIGLNPRNNVVDITNFVLHETGQPLHAFDADRIDGDTIVVRTCPEGTPFTTLDDVERKLSDTDLMICSATAPLCLAGVMGGMGSAVSETTTTVFLESAYFNPTRVRKTARRHGINSDSSFRFERGADPNMAIYALKRAALLIRELAGGQISSPITDVYPDRVEPFRFEVSCRRVCSLIGKEIPRETIISIIRALEIDIEKENGDILYVAVPPFRVDVCREADLAEEILRIYGYNNVEFPPRMNSALAYAAHPDRWKIRNIVSDYLSDNGFTEIMSNSLTKSSYYESLESYPARNCVRIMNPLSSDLDVMRQTLLFNALEAVELNVNRRNTDLKFYEFGNCYHYDESRRAENALSPYRETSRLAITITGDREMPSWNHQAAPTDFYYLRGYTERILKRFGLDIYAMEAETSRSDIFDEALTVKSGEKEFFTFGAVSRETLKQFDLKSQVYFLEMDFGILVKLSGKSKVSVKELSKYPEVRRDLALLVDKPVNYSDLRKLAFATERKLLKSVSLFDVYEGDKLPEGKKSYALSFILEDKSATLTDHTIDKVMKNLVSRFEKEFGATVRR